jgi:hypothetical protein
MLSPRRSHLRPRYWWFARHRVDNPGAPGQPNQEAAMDQEALNLSIRKFLKHFGVTAQREIEQAVQRGLDNGTLRGHEAIPVRATLVLGGLLRDFSIDGEITLQATDG